MNDIMEQMDKSHVRDVRKTLDELPADEVALKIYNMTPDELPVVPQPTPEGMEGVDRGRGSHLSTNTTRDTRQTGNDGNASTGIYESGTASVVTQHGMYGDTSSLRTTQSRRGLGDDGDVGGEPLQDTQERKSQSKLDGELSNAPASKGYGNGSRAGRNLDETLHNRGNQPEKFEGTQLSLFNMDNGHISSPLSDLEQEKRAISYQR